MVWQIISIIFVDVQHCFLIKKWFLKFLEYLVIRLTFQLSGILGTFLSNITILYNQKQGVAPRKRYKTTFHINYVFKIHKNALNWQFTNINKSPEMIPKKFVRYFEAMQTDRWHFNQSTTTNQLRETKLIKQRTF